MDEAMSHKLSTLHEVQIFSVLSEFYYQLMHKRIALKGVLKFTLKQLQHVLV